MEVNYYRDEHSKYIYISVWTSEDIQRQEVTTEMKIMFFGKILISFSFLFLDMLYHGIVVRTSVFMKVISDYTF